MLFGNGLCCYVVALLRRCIVTVMCYCDVSVTRCCIVAFCIVASLRYLLSCWLIHCCDVVALRLFVTVSMQSHCHVRSAAFPSVIVRCFVCDCCDDVAVRCCVFAMLLCHVVAMFR